MCAVLQHDPSHVGSASFDREDFLVSIHACQMSRQLVAGGSGLVRGTEAQLVRCRRLSTEFTKGVTTRNLVELEAELSIAMRSERVVRFTEVAAAS
jgi:hypothetical protein